MLSNRISDPVAFVSHLASTKTGVQPYPGKLFLIPKNDDVRDHEAPPIPSLHELNRTKAPAALKMPAASKVGES